MRTRLLFAILLIIVLALILKYGAAGAAPINETSARGRGFEEYSRDSRIRVCGNHFSQIDAGGARLHVKAIGVAYAAKAT